MSDKTIKLKVIFNIKAEKIYSALMSSKLQSQFTGSKCVIGKKVGGRFSAFDDYASGKNLELVPNKKIVQSWRASDWPKGVVSKINFEFEETKGKTILTFTQTGVPEEFAKEIERGWGEYYWNPIKEMFK
ncbi:MAG: SRPBCC family protein [Candidatus Diapherotrites archaeon]|nr:SRPBCC family protein [Candidatus Diapherotrites archaeon]